MVKVVATLTLGSDWATEWELSQMSDEEVIELVWEDIAAFVDTATMKVEGE